jgi:hypothetical protein
MRRLHCRGAAPRSLRCGGAGHSLSTIWWCRPLAVVNKVAQAPCAVFTVAVPPRADFDVVLQATRLVSMVSQTPRAVFKVAMHPPRAVSMWWCRPLAFVSMVTQTPCAVFKKNGANATRSLQATRLRQYGDADTMRRVQKSGANATRSLQATRLRQCGGADTTRRVKP